MSDTTITSTPPPKTEQAKETAAEVASSAGASAAEVAEQAKEQAGAVVSTATDQISQVVGTARQELRDRAASEASSLGDRLGEIAEELRAMGQASSEHGGVAASLVSGVADQVDRGARRLSAGDLESTLNDVKRVARNRPGTFLLGAVGAGFLVGRLLRHTDLKEVGQAVKPSSPDPAPSNGLSQAPVTGRPAPSAPSAPAPTGPAGSAPTGTFDAPPMGSPTAPKAGEAI